MEIYITNPKQKGLNVYVYAMNEYCPVGDGETKSTDADVNLATQ